MGNDMPDETSIILATAHPAKFPDTIMESIGESPKHEDLEKLKELNPKKASLSAETSVIRDYLESNILV